MWRQPERSIKYFLFPLVIAMGSLNFSVVPPARAAPSPLAASEKKTRADDLAAVNYFKEALEKLDSVQNLKRVGAKRPNIYIKLIELLNQIALAQFRLSHNSPTPEQNTRDVQNYQATLKRIVEATTQLITVSPRAPEAPRALFLRARSLQELEIDQAAIRDYKYIVEHGTNLENSVQAHFGLYDLQIKTKDYRSALLTMKHLKIAPSDSFYTLAMDHIATAYFLLGEIPQAIQVLRTSLQKYPVALTSGDDDQAKIANAERTQILTNIALYYFTGMDQKLGGFTAVGAFQFLKSLHMGPQGEKTLKYLANLMKTKSMDEPLEQLKREAIKDPYDPNATIGLLLSVFENETAKRQYLSCYETVLAMLKFQKQSGPIQKALSSDRAQLALTETAKQMQNRLGRLQKTPEGTAVATLLTQLDQLLVLTTPHPTVRFKYRYNLAETLLFLKRYGEAADQYHWIGEHSDSSSAGKELAVNSKGKAIIALFEHLNAKNFFPKELKAQSLAQNTDSKLEPESLKLAQWIDALEYHYPAAIAETLDSIGYEVNRLFYSRGRIKDSISRMVEFAQARPNSTQTVPSISLTLDTLINSNQWNETYKLSSGFIRRLPAQAAPFKVKLAGIASDSFFKITEKAFQDGKNSEAIKLVDAFLKENPKDKRRAQYLNLAANAALAEKDRKRALGYFAQISPAEATPAILATSRLTRASLAEEQFNFQIAATDYSQYLSLPNFKSPLSQGDQESLKIKLITYSWLNSNPVEVARLTSQLGFCSGRVKATCIEVQTLASMRPLSPNRNIASESSAQFKRQMDLVRSADESIKASQVINALLSPALSGFHEKIELLNLLAESWPKASSTQKFVLIPYLNAAVPNVLQSVVQRVKNIAPIKLDQKLIKQRVKTIERVEKVAEVLSEFPMTRIRAIAFNEWANLYSDFSQDIMALPKPKSLPKSEWANYQKSLDEVRAPFLEKANKFRTNAFQIASEAGLDLVTYRDIVYRMTKDNPLDSTGKPSDFSKALSELGTQPLPFSPPSLEDLLGSRSGGEWTKAYRAALTEGNLQKISYLVQYSQANKVLEEKEQSIVSALSLLRAGALAEGLGPLTEVLGDLPGPAQTRLNLSLAQHFYLLRNLQKAKKHLEALKLRERVDPQVANRLLAAVAWSKAEVPNSLKRNLEEMKK